MRNQLQHPLLIVGLGNPGSRYDDTRHNVGAAAVAKLAASMRIKLKRSFLRRAWIGRNDAVVLARPNAFMNLSGPVVRGLVKAFGKAPPLIVSDDLDLPLGRIRFRTAGSAGGHRGLASIIEAIGTSAFPRLKIGIGRPASGVEVSDHVLARFTEIERDTCDRALARAAQALGVAATQGIERAMTEFSE